MKTLVIDEIEDHFDKAFLEPLIKIRVNTFFLRDHGEINRVHDVDILNKLAGLNFEKFIRVSPIASSLILHAFLTAVIWLAIVCMLSCFL
jgi:hypothetical protein